MIIGGGASGIAALTAYSARNPSSRIALVDPEEIGFGRAFGFADPMLLTNTPVGVMSLDVDDPYDFERYLHRRGWNFGPDSFVPRYLVAQYCRERYLRTGTMMRQTGGEVRHVKGRCRRMALANGGSTPVEVHTDEGRVLRARSVVLAMGLSRRHTDVAGSCRGEETAVEPVRTNPGTSTGRVLVLGTKLSAIDAAVTALAAGNDVVMCSPSGLLPAVRTRLSCAPTPPRGHNVVAAPAIPAHTDAAPEPKLAEEVALAEADQAPWQDLVGPFIDELNASARGWSSADVKSFRADHARLLARYVSAMPLHNARILLAAMREGRLEVRRGVPDRLTHSDSHSDVSWDSGLTETYDAVLNATGFLPPTLPTVQPGIGHDDLVFDTEEDGNAAARLDIDLRVWAGDVAWPVWAIGSAAHTRTPIVNYLRTATLQAAEVADSILDRTTERETYVRAAD
ncbi:FAD/NAD(P)-binding protein [Actinopolyspora mortivallis]|uniref:FAD/NAD(P)-binding protein n=1 Tax=Actinopolyspora mortivallis TaxID=33906 RepID=UPI0015E5D08F|nr:FAD/NAD(P)-binding protein [Actinopolyspora mortivallis]